MSRSRCVLTFVLVFPILVVAHQPEGRSSAPERLGTVHFETSCAPAVRSEFDHAVALLHSFEFRRAMDGFTAVLAADPSCAVAYWGIALCHWGNPFAGVKAGPLLDRGLEAAQKGLATGSPTPRERGYISAVSELYKNAGTVPHRDRIVAYASAMDTLQREFPQDIEARIFYALAVTQTARPTDKSYSAQLAAAAILEPLWARYPDHPGLPHYIIHAYDYPPLAARALDAARSYAKVAPSAPHALHMPSHTFTRVGYWKESVETNAASERVSLEQNVVGEALHAMDYQIYANLQMAHDGAARALLERLPGTVAKLDVNAMGGAAPPAAGIYAAAAIPARFALERGAWAEAAALQAKPSAFPNADAISYFARALGAARSGTPAAATPDLAQLAALRDRLAEMKDDYWREQVDIERQVAAAWVAYAEGHKAEAIAALRAAVDAEDATDKAAISPGPIAPARELLGEMLLDAGHAADALVAFEATMKKEPRRFRGTYGAARAAEAKGDGAKAREYYLALLAIADSAEPGRPELQQAKAYVAR